MQTQHIIGVITWRLIPDTKGKFITMINILNEYLININLVRKLKRVCKREVVIE